MTTQDLKKQLMEEFDKDYCNIYSGDSGLGGNDPQETVDEFACYPSDVRKFLSSALSRLEDAVRESVVEEIVNKYGDYRIDLSNKKGRTLRFYLYPHFKHKTGDDVK